MNYLYALTNVDFDNENQDVVYFKTESAKDSYFNLSSLFDSSNKNEINFEKKNLLDVKFVIDTNANNQIQSEFGYNYIIIKELSTSFYYFYFINKIMYESVGKMILTCHLDIFTTYFDKLVFESGLIKRATFREFVKDGTDVVYDTQADSHVFSIDDSYQGKKFLQYDKTLQPHIYTYLSASTLDTWLEENVEAWQYMFVDCTHQYQNELYGIITSYRSVDEFLSNGINTSYGVLASPIYRTTNRIYIKLTDITDPNDPIVRIVELSQSAITKFKEANQDFSYVYSSKISKQPPFTPITSATDLVGEMFVSIYTSSGDLYLDFGEVSTLDNATMVQPFTKIFYNVLNANNSENKCMIEMTYQMNRFYNNDVSSIVSNYIKTRMPIATYLGTTKDFYKYPNATSLKNIELKITYNGQEYSTTPTKIDTGSAVIEMMEAISPDLAKTYVRWKPTGYYCFRTANDKTLTGGVFADDTSITLGTSALQNVLANNKNFFMQRYVNMQSSGLLNMAGSIAKGDPLGVAKSLAQYQLNSTNFTFEVDNIENQPAHLQKASGNSLFNILTKEYGLHLEIWIMTREDITNVADYYNRFGEVSSYIDSLKSYCLEKHKYFDYVEYDCYKINTSSCRITNEIRDELKRKLSRGVRFWYSSLYNYYRFNYEVAFE